MNFTVIDIVAVVGADGINNALYYFSLNKFCENKKNHNKTQRPKIEIKQKWLK